MSHIEDSFTLGRAAGAISIFVAMFTALGIFLSNPTAASVPTLAVIAVVAMIILSLSGWVWDFLFKDF